MTNNDLINKIKRLKNVEPSETWLVSNREFIFKYVELDGKNRPVAQTGSVFSVSAVQSRIAFALSLFQNRILSGSIAMAAIFILVGGFVSGKAQGSLPGDALYSVKTFMEKTQLAFAYSDEKRVALNFELTEKRLDEFSAIAVKSGENSGEIKVAADNLKNQLKVTAQEVNNAKSNSSAETAVSVAKIADTKTIAYAKKLDEVKKDLSEKKKEQVSDVALNVEALSDSALAVLATNSKEGDVNIEEIAAKLKEKIALAEAKISETQKNVSLYEKEIKNSAVENKEAVESLALSVKLITEARAVLVEAQAAFDARDFAKTWDLLVNAGEIAKVGESVGSRVAVVSPQPSISPIPSAEPLVSPSISPLPSVDPEVSPVVSPVISPLPSPKASEGEASPSAEPSVEPSVSPTPSAIPIPKASVTPSATPSPTPVL